jgi:TrmH family RNA methyltransferase
MITKSQVKHIQSLEEKKYRLEHAQFVVEGEKMVMELIQSDLKIISIYALREWINKNQALTHQVNIIEVELFELEKISTLSTPNKVLAIAELPAQQIKVFNLALLLDGIQDPGNLGSIIRIADWYGIQAIYCSESSADTFNSKVIQASMGGVFRIPVFRCDLNKFIQDHPNIPVYSCLLEGKDINTFAKIDEGFIIIGNESKGISESLIDLTNYKVSILRKGRAESLNAAVAAGIICHCLLS